MNVDDLAELARGYREADAVASHEVRVCMAASCQSSGAQPLFDGARGGAGRGRQLQDEGRRPHGTLFRRAAGGRGRTRRRPRGLCLYRDVQPSDAADILSSVGNAPLQRLRCPTDQPFFARQQRVVLETPASSIRKACTPTWQRAATPRSCTR